MTSTLSFHAVINLCHRLARLSIQFVLWFLASYNFRANLKISASEFLLYLAKQIHPHFEHSLAIIDNDD